MGVEHFAVRKVQAHWAGKSCVTDQHREEKRRNNQADRLAVDGAMSHSVSSPLVDGYQRRARNDHGHTVDDGPNC